MWHGRGAPVCVPISVRGLLQSRALGTAVPLPPDYAMPPPPPGCYPLVDAKHHVVEVFEVISFPAADDHLLVLCIVDAYGVLSLDLPGGKRRLAETAWEAAAREAANVAGLRVAVGGGRLGGADGAPTAAARPSGRSRARRPERPLLRPRAEGRPRRRAGRRAP